MIVDEFFGPSTFLEQVPVVRLRDVTNGRC